MILFRKFANGSSRVDYGRDWEVDELVRDRQNVIYAAELELVEGIPTAARLFGDDSKYYREAIEAAQGEF